MRTGSKILAGLFGMSVFCAWAESRFNQIESARWLVGTWENKTPRGSVFETWNKVNDNELSGKSYVLKEKDTIVFETIRLVKEESGLFYIPVVKNQNEGMPVRFSATTMSANQLVFENQQHDFPQVISYTKVGSDSLVAEISGTKNGQARKQTFSMKRVK